MSAETSPAVAAQQAVLHKQLGELKQLRHDMQAMYDASQSEVAEAQQAMADAQGEAAKERERSATLAADNATLRQWNERLAADLAQLLAELRSQTDTDAMGLSASGDAGHEGEEVEAAHLMATAAVAGASSGAGSTTGVTVDISVLQQAQLEGSATALRLTHAHARLKRRGKELRAAGERNAQLQQTAQALSADLAAATSQIGKLEQRMRQHAETARSLEQLQAEHGAQGAALERTAAQLARAKEEYASLVNGPLAAAERRVAELDERDRRARAILERKVRQAAEMAAAVQTLGADSRLRIEENVKLRLLAQRLGATHKEIDAVRRSVVLDGPATASAASPDASPPAPRSPARRVDAAAPSSVASSPASTWGAPLAAADQGVPLPSRSAAAVAASPMEALQSQMALQEKLRKVRSQFADIRTQVGVGFEENEKPYYGHGDR